MAEVRYPVVDSKGPRRERRQPASRLREAAHYPRKNQTSSTPAVAATNPPRRNASDDKNGYREEFLELVRTAAELAGESVAETDE